MPPFLPLPPSADDCHHIYASHATYAAPFWGRASAGGPPSKADCPQCSNPGPLAAACTAQQHTGPSAQAGTLRLSGPALSARACTAEGLAVCSSLLAPSGRHCCYSRAAVQLHPEGMWCPQGATAATGATSTPSANFKWERKPGGSGPATAGAAAAAGGAGGWGAAAAAVNGSSQTTPQGEVWQSPAVCRGRHC